MASLLDTYPDESFQLLLKLAQALDNTLRTMEAGDGTALPVQASSLGFNFTGFVRAGGVDLLTKALAANALFLGDGSGAASALALAANKFPARASSGDVTARTISDAALAFLAAADNAAMRSALGATLDTLAGVTSTSYGRNLLAVADQNALRTALGLAIGTNVQAYRAELAKLGVQGTDIPSAASIDLGAATGEFVRITGTTTIFDLGTAAAGIGRTVIFASALTLTHNATSLILPAGGSNIVVAAGDAARFVSLGSGNWKCVGYEPASGVSAVLSSRIASEVENFAATPATVSGFSYGEWLAALGRYELATDADFSKTSSTTLSDISSLVSPTLEVGARYNFRADLSFECASAGGTAWAVKLPPSSSFLSAKIFVHDRDTTSLVAANVLTSSGETLSVLGSATVNGIVSISGTFTTSVVAGTDGNLSIQFAQQASSGSPSQVLAGATLSITKL